MTKRQIKIPRWYEDFLRTRPWVVRQYPKVLLRTGPHLFVAFMFNPDTRRVIGVCLDADYHGAVMFKPCESVAKEVVEYFNGTKEKN